MCGRRAAPTAARARSLEARPPRAEATAPLQPSHCLRRTGTGGLGAPAQPRAAWPRLRGPLSPRGLSDPVAVRWWWDQTSGKGRSVDFTGFPLTRDKLPAENGLLESFLSCLARNIAPRSRGLCPGSSAGRRGQLSQNDSSLRWGKSLPGEIVKVAQTRRLPANTAPATRASRSSVPVKKLGPGDLCFPP